METLIYDYGVSVTVDFDTYITANPEAVASSFTPASGDVKYSTNHGSTFTSTTNTASFANGVVSVVLTAAEMQVSEMVLKFEDQDAALVTDSMVKVLTKNHASAFYSGIDVATDASGRVSLATGVPIKNAAFSNLPVSMVDSTDHVTQKTGLTLTVNRSLDGGAFGSGTGTAAEIGNGAYQYDASAADMNADVILFRFSATGADDTFITVLTQT